MQSEIERELKTKLSIKSIYVHMYSIRILFYSYLFVMRADELNAAYNESLDECPVQCTVQNTL